MGVHQRLRLASTGSLLHKVRSFHPRGWCESLALLPSTRGCMLSARGSHKSHYILAAVGETNCPGPQALFASQNLSPTREAD